MHDLAHQCAYARVFDCWWVAAKKKNCMHTSLNKFALSQPTWDDLVDMSQLLAVLYLDKPTLDDQDFHNNSLILARLLQYVELTHTP